MAAHPSTLALKIPWTEEPGAGYYPWGCKESGTTKGLLFHFSLEIGKDESSSCILLFQDFLAIWNPLRF